MGKSLNAPDVVKKISIRYGSFFYKSKLSIRVLFAICYLYIKDISLVQASKLLGDDVSSKSIHQWYTYFHEVTSLYLRHNTLSFGTKVSVVQLDESYLGHQPKYFRCLARPTVRDFWYLRHEF